MSHHPAFAAGHTAVITGAASGIGLAAAKHFAATGVNVVLADLDGERLRAAEAAVREHGATFSGNASTEQVSAAEVVAVATDVSRIEDVQALERTARDRFGAIHIVMNNAAIDAGGPTTGHYANWQKLMGVNLWGVINGVQTFTLPMVAQGTPGVIINTGSKQGITLPPGNSAYNVAKAGVKAVTESLAHELRTMDGCRVTAHLLIPGFTFTGLTKSAEKPKDAWSAEQVVAFMIERIDAGDFYLLCPDNAVTREMDNRRMAWAMGDLIENRPALSRWHPDYKERFEAFLRDGGNA